MNVVYKPKTDVVCITIKHAAAARSEQIEGDLIVNYDEHNDVTGIEVHRASQRSCDPRRIQCALQL